jgi:manganese efflux pump family protein
VLSILFVAVALGLSNLAASIAIGLQGVNGTMRRDIILIFGFFEAAMPVLGLLIGRRLVDSVGSSASYAGGGLLVLTGIYTLVQARRESSSAVSHSSRRGGLIVTGAALSIDNLIVGFALGTYKVPVVLGALTIAVVSVAMSLIGLELGHRLGASVEKWSGELAGAVLIVVGILIAMGAL